MNGGICVFLKLYNNTSEKNTINKSLINEISLEGNLRGQCTIKNPVIDIVSNGNAPTYNYAFIPEFNRYYFIDNITSVRTGLWSISMTCDVLMSFKTDILNSYAIINHTQENEITQYMSSDIWKTLVKDKTDIINFPNGLLETGEYILITAGGNS